MCIRTQLFLIWSLYSRSIVMATTSFSTVDVNIAQVIMELVIILVAMLEPIESAFMRRYLRVLFGTLFIETALIAGYAYMRHAMLDAVQAMVLWEAYKLVRLFVSLALCYPITILINHTVKLHAVFFALASIIIVGTALNYAKSTSGSPTGFNNIAFMLIFIFTLQQYWKLKQHIEVVHGDVIRSLNSLVAIEIVLISLNILLVVLFFSGTTHLLQSLRLSLTLVQYLKIHMIMSLFASYRTV